MTYIKNNKVLVLIIGVLLLSNVALLYFYLRKPCTNKNQGGGQSPREYMIGRLKNEVGFSDDQVSKYTELSDKHKEAMKPLFNDIYLAKDSLYKMLQLPQQPADSVINQQLDRIGEKQEAIDQRIFNHFYTLKQICTPDQQPKYDSVIQDVIRHMIKPKKGSDNKNKKNKI
jgi:periplasmic protein CpxP/Spy